MEFNKLVFRARINYRLNCGKTDETEFVLFLPNVTDDFGTAVLGRLNNGAEIFDAEGDVFDAIAVSHQMRAHLRVIVGFVRRFEDEANLKMKKKG